MVDILKNLSSKNTPSQPQRLDLPQTDPRDLLYISDLDGTLLSSSGTLSQDSIQRLNRLIDRGLKFTIATARNYDSARPILKGLNLKIPAVLFNGVYLTDFDTGQNVILADFITQEVVDDLLQIVMPLDLHPFIYSYLPNGCGHRVYYREATNPGATAYLTSLDGDGRLCQVDNYAFADDEKVSGFLLIDNQKTLEPVYQTLNKKYPDDISLYFAEDVSLKNYHWLQAYHQEATKANMIKLLSQHLKHPLENIVVFGDYLNDLSMFEIAGRAIAVSNALPEVKQAAHEIIGSNDSCAVIDYLESLDFP